MSFESVDVARRPRRKITTAVVGGTLAVLAFAGCSGGGAPQSKAIIPAVTTKGPEGPNQTAPQSVEVIPNFHKLTKNPDACEGGNIADCSQPLYFQPAEPTPVTIIDVANQLVLAGTQPNGTKDYAAIWPLEPFQGNPGDKMKVVCQVEGESIHNADGQSTTIWNVIAAPSKLLSHSAITKAEAEITTAQSNPGYHAAFGFQDIAGKITQEFLYASALWTDHSIDLHLQACTPLENPSNYPSLQG